MADTKEGSLVDPLLLVPGDVVGLSLQGGHYVVVGHDAACVATAVLLTPNATLLRTAFGVWLRMRVGADRP